MKVGGGKKELGNGSRGLPSQPLHPGMAFMLLHAHTALISTAGSGSVTDCNPCSDGTYNARTGGMWLPAAPPRRGTAVLKALSPACCHDTAFCACLSRSWQHHCLLAVPQRHVQPLPGAGGVQALPGGHVCPQALHQLHPLQV